MEVWASSSWEEEEEEEEEETLGTLNSIFQITFRPFHFIKEKKPNSQVFFSGVARKLRERRGEERRRKGKNGDQAIMSTHQQSTHVPLGERTCPDEAATKAPRSTWMWQGNFYWTKTLTLSVSA